MGEEGRGSERTPGRDRGTLSEVGKAGAGAAWRQSQENLGFAEAVGLWGQMVRWEMCAGAQGEAGDGGGILHLLCPG